MDLKHLKALETIKEGIPIEVLEDMIENREKYTEELLEILDHTVNNAKELSMDESFVLHIAAMYTLSYYREKRAYPYIVSISKLAPDIINPLLDHTITEGLSSMLASVYDGNLELIKEIIESSDCYVYVRRAALGSIVILTANEIIDREEVVCYFKELYNQKLHLLNDDVIDCLVDKSLDIHPKGLEEEILGHSSSDIHYDLEEESSKSIECVLEETKIYYEYQFVSKKDVLHLSNWLGSPINSQPFYNSDIGKGFDSFLNRFGFNNALTNENKTVRKIEKIGRNQPCPCGSGKKYKKCCGE